MAGEASCWRRLLAPAAAAWRPARARQSAATHVPSAAARAAAGSTPPPPPAVAVAAGEVLELSCEDLAFGGEGICRLPGGLVVFVDRALPGEQLTARITQSKKSYARATKLQTLRPHDAAAEPVCQHFGPCGGCTLQHLQYQAQLAAKQRQVASLLTRTAGVAEADLHAVLRPIVGCPPGQHYGYRNKFEFSFQAVGAAGSSSSSGRIGRGGRGGSRGQPTHPSAAAAASSSSDGFILGLHKPGSNTEVLPISRCHLQSDAANALLQQVMQLCQRLGLQAYDPVRGSGLLQHVVIRRGTASSLGGGDSGSDSGSSSSSSSSSDRSSIGSSREEYLVNVVTAKDGREALSPLARALIQPEPPQSAAAAPAGIGTAAAAGPAQPQPHPVVVGVVNSVSQRGRPAGERRLAAEHVLAGRGQLTERLCGLEFEVSANSFFQTNTAQAEVLYQLVAQAAELRPSDVVLDLYCGTGSIGLTLASACRHVHGVEINEAAVRDARRNAQRNGITNASFLQGDLQKLQLEGKLPAPDVVVVDPARPGLSPAVVTYLRGCGARKVVYVSCNASTQARDIKLLCAADDKQTGSSSSSAGSSTVRGDGGTASSAGPYCLVSMQACDLYPHTWHVETVAVLEAAA